MILLGFVLVLKCGHPQLSNAPDMIAAQTGPGEYFGERESPAWLGDPTAFVENTVEQNEFSRDLYRLPDELPLVYRTVLTLVDRCEPDTQKQHMY